MIAALYIIIFFSAFLVVFTYLIYPLFVALLAKGKQQGGDVYDERNLPRIALVFAAYNEEKVIAAKMKNLAAINYPTHLLDIYIGLDAPSDNTAALIDANKTMNFKLSVHNFEQRSGKSGVLNKLFSCFIELSDYEAIIMSDANIISKENTVLELVKYFKDKHIGVVGAVIKNRIDFATEIAQQEEFYIKNESKLKVNEGVVFKSSIGAFGAFYAIRSQYIKPIPKNYLMEDFYLSMNALNEGAFSITNPKAIVYEDLPGTIAEEFKRKRRISTGNFQNLTTYFPLLLSQNFRVSFPFFSHKVLRWITPFLLMISCINVLILFLINPTNTTHQILLILMLVNFLLPLFDIALHKLKISVNLLRLHRYFMTMNLALFLGFIDFIKGVKTNVWKPTKRV